MDDIQALINAWLTENPNLALFNNIDYLINNYQEQKQQENHVILIDKLYEHGNLQLSYPPKNVNEFLDIFSDVSIDNISIKKQIGYYFVFHALGDIDLNSVLDFGTLLLLNEPTQRYIQGLVHLDFSNDQEIQSYLLLKTQLPHHYLVISSLLEHGFNQPSISYFYYHNPPIQSKDDAKLFIGDAAGQEIGPNPRAGEYKIAGKQAYSFQEAETDFCFTCHSNKNPVFAIG